MAQDELYNIQLYLQKICNVKLQTAGGFNNRRRIAKICHAVQTDAAAGWKGKIVVKKL
jgi:L-alanine-DL-glutamate epimerase-like enolase superfamily enzyme